MSITSVTYKQFNIPTMHLTTKSEKCAMVSDFCKSFVLPNEQRNYSKFDEKLASKIASYKEKAVKKAD